MVISILIWVNYTYGENNNVLKIKKSLNLSELFDFSVEKEELSKDMQNNGYPRTHRHKLCCLRQELTEAFVE